MRAAKGGRKRGIDLWMLRICSKRCSECRACFRAVSSAQETQKVCSPRCRCRRRRRLARKRRAQRVQDYRVDERERQRRSRARRRGSGTGPPDCHAPPSASKSADLVEELLESWDRAVAMSLHQIAYATRCPIRNITSATKTHISVSNRLSLYPGENKPIFAGDATMDIAYPEPRFRGSGSSPLGAGRVSVVSSR